MPSIFVVPVALIAVLALGAFALYRAEEHAVELREALLLLLLLAVVSAGAALATLGPSTASRGIKHVTTSGIFA